MKSFFADHPVILTSLRWVLFIPIGMLAGVASAYIWRFGMNTGYAGNAGEVFYELSLTNGFAGNFFLGPVLVVGEMVITSFCGMFAALYLVPKSRAVVGGILIGMLLMLGVLTFIMQGSQFEFVFPFEARIRFCLEWIGILIGCILAIITVSNFMTDYVRDGVYNLDQAVDASWNEILLGNVTGKISEHGISNQIDFIKKTEFYKLLSGTSKEITTEQLCSVSWQNKTTFFQYIKLCHILEVEMSKEFLSWNFEQRNSLKNILEKIENPLHQELYKNFILGESVDDIKLSLGNCIFLLKEFGSFISNHNTTQKESPFFNQYNESFINWISGKDCHKEAQKIISKRNKLVHREPDGKTSLLGIMGVKNLLDLEKDNLKNQGFLNKFLARKKSK